MTITNSVVRAAYASFMAEAKGWLRAGSLAQRMFPHDRAAQHMISRSAVTPASFEEAEALVQQSVSAFMGSLAPLSASARLMQRGLPISVTGHASVAVPYRTARAALKWVAAGDPIPVQSRMLGAAKIGPLKKIAGITVYSRELADAASGEAIFERMLREDAADSLDAAVFGTDAGSDEKPAGILNGLTPVAATFGGGLAAMEADLIALAGAVTAAGAQSVVFVTTPALAATVMVRKPELKAEVWSAVGLPAGRVIALDPAAFAFASGGVDVEASKNALLHMDDDAPNQISTGGTVAAPARSMFQTDLIATRLIFDVSFAMRAPGLAAFIDGAAW